MGEELRGEKEGRNEVRREERRWIGEGKGGRRRRGEEKKRNWRKETVEKGERKWKKE